MQIKNIIPILVLCLIGCSSSKHHVTPEPVQEENPWLANYAIDDIGFDFTSGFDYDRVEFRVEGKVVFQGTLVTDESTAFADDITIKKYSDVMNVEIFVNGRKFAHTLSLKNGRFFNISYYEDQVEIMQDKEPWFYD